MISFMISMCAHVWYHTQRKCYDFMIWMLLYHVQKSYYIKCTWNIYDIMTKGVISYMITDMISSFYFIWYWVYLWYHTFSYDIITISYTWYYAWYCSMILRDRFHDIFFANYIVNKTIWCYVYLKIRWYHKKCMIYVIAGGAGGMGPCPPSQHQPPGVEHTYNIL